MSVELENAARYRQYAEGLRVAAKQAHSETRRALIGIALEYDRLADMLEDDHAVTTALAKRLAGDDPKGVE